MKLQALFLLALLAVPAQIAMGRPQTDATATPPATTARNATRRLREFLDADWKYWVGEYPENATLFGYDGENGRWTDYSQAAIDRRDAHLRQSLAALEAIPRGE